MTFAQIAREAATEIANDLKARAGTGYVFAQREDLQEEIIEAWTKIIIMAWNRNHA